MKVTNSNSFRIGNILFQTLSDKLVIYINDFRKIIIEHELTWITKESLKRLELY